MREGSLIHVDSVENIVDHEARAESRSARELILGHMKNCEHENERREQQFQELREDNRETRSAITDASKSWSEGAERIHSKIDSDRRTLSVGVIAVLLSVIGASFFGIIELQKILLALTQSH